MKAILIGIGFVLQCVAMVFAQPSRHEDASVIRIMSYNIHCGVGLDGKRDLERIASVIREAAPDVVAVQEVDSVTERSGKMDMLRTLGSSVLMYPVYGAAIDYQGGKYGIGVLAKEKPLRWHTLPLPGREEARVLLVVEFDKYIFCATHFSLTEDDRLLTADQVKEAVKIYDKPVFLAGDLNAHPDSPAIKSLKERFRLLTSTKRLTFPADEPSECIDYIMGLKTEGIPAYALLRSGVIEEKAASDHRPVYADVKLGAKKESIFRTRPYLQNPDGKGITISWLTHVPVYAWVEYGPDSACLHKAHTIVDGQVIANNFNHQIRLSDLIPGKTYYYRVCSKEILSYKAYSKIFGQTAVSDLFSFVLQEENNRDFTALIFNDIHKQSRTMDRLCDQVKDVKYDFVFFNGDCIDDPADEEEAVAFLSYFNDKVGACRVPVFYLRGNHEIRNAYSIQLRALFDYVGDKTYGAFNWGDTRFVMLDCGEDKPDSTGVYYGLNDFSQLRLDQIGFLREELASEVFKKAGKKVLIHHIPVFGNTDDYQPCKELWGELLSVAPFHVAINAHTHRFAYHPADSSHSFPVVVGGGYSLKSATVMILSRKGKDMKLTVLDSSGKILKELML